MSTPRCGPPPTRWPAMRWARSCWKSGGRRVSSISSPAANSHWLRKLLASLPCCCALPRSRCLRRRRPDGSCARRIRRRDRPQTHGARRCSMRNSFVTVMARSGGGSWNGNVMSAFSANQRRILSLWLPRLPIDRIKRQLSRNSAAQANHHTGTALPLPLAGEGWGGGAAASQTLRVERAPTRIASFDAIRPPPQAGEVKQEVPSIVVAKQGNALQIFAVDDAAVRLGLEIGLPLANARAICPELTVFDADEAADRKTLEDIADWCDRFTPLVALDPPHGLFLDITGCAHLFGGEAALLRMVCAALSGQGFAVSAAIAGTAICARTMTRCVSGTIVADGEEAEAVGPLPVFSLGADEAITRGLRRAGLKTIGDVALRARREITARFGARFTTLLEQALGQGDAPISPRKPLPDYIDERRFAEPVATEDVISVTLSGLAGMLVK